MNNSRNPLLTYQDLLVQTDAEARDEYEFDPRVQFLNLARGVDVQGFPNGQDLAGPDQPYTLSSGEDDDTDGFPSRGDSKTVQITPKMVPRKQLIVLDTAHRDWTLQSNAYQCTFAFGSPTTTPSNTAFRIPIFQNNPTVPVTAVENLAGIPGLPNVNGFTINNVGTFPPYNANSNSGPIITYDNYSNTVVSNFSTTVPISNVIAMKLARAVLPHRRFFTLAPEFLAGETVGTSNTNTVSDTLSCVSGCSTTVVTETTFAASATVRNMLTTFMSEPYLLLFVNSYQGQYYGGNDPVNRAFTVLAQDRRITLNPDIGIATQFQDYYPWSDETFKFNAPIGALPKFTLTLTKNTGTVYQQIDDMVVTQMSFISAIPFFNVSGTNPTALATIECSIARSTLSGGPGGVYFRNELRPGDRVRFYPQALANILTLSAINASPYASTYSNLFSWMLTNDATVLCNTAAYNGKADMYRSFVFAYNPMNYAGIVPPSVYIDSNAFPINLANIPGQSTLSISGSGISLISGYSNWIPMINTNMQATFAFEMTTLVPDTTSLSSVPTR